MSIVTVLVVNLKYHTCTLIVEYMNTQYMYVTNKLSKMLLQNFHSLCCLADVYLQTATSTHTEYIHYFFLMNKVIHSFE